MGPRRLVLFVEGKGDIAAVPTLARRVISSIGAHDALFVDGAEPFRVSGIGPLVKDNCANWHRWLATAGKTRKDVGAVLLVLDADANRVPGNWASYTTKYKSTDFCPYRVAAMLAHEARASRAGEAFSLAAVFAVQEFEAWLVAGIESLRGITLAERRGIVPAGAAVPPIDIESKRDAKGLLESIVRGYNPSLDQAILAAKVDLSAVAARSRSFRRLQSALSQLADAVRAGKAIVSPTD